MTSSLMSINATTTKNSTVPCDGFQNVDTKGLNGTICAALIEPRRLNISSCCESEIRLPDSNCSQHCGSNSDDFSDCVNDLWNGTHISTTCQWSDGSRDESGTISASGGAATDTDSPSQSTGAGKLCRSLHLGQLGFTSIRALTVPTAPSAKAMSHTVFFLAVSSIMLNIFAIL